MLAKHYQSVGKITIPSVSSNTPDVVNFFRQVSNTNLEDEKLTPLIALILNTL